MEANLKNIHARIKKVCQDAGRSEADIRLIAVSKKQSAEKIASLFHFGQCWFGENYVQELESKKQELFHLPIKWSYIGRIQTNKIKKMVALADEIQTVSRLEEAKKIDEAAEVLGKAPYPIYLSVNFGKEPSKSGVLVEEAISLAEQIGLLKNLQLQGMMVIPPEEISLAAQAGCVPQMYRDIALMAKKIGHGFLSLGMSTDLEAAIESGATTVRVGEALMGKRIL